MIALFQKTGWEVETMTGRCNFAPEETKKALNVFSTFAPVLNVTPEQIQENLMVYQWVIRARCVV